AIKTPAKTVIDKPTQPSQPLITINVQESFVEEEKIYFDYILYSEEDVELTYIAHVECPNAPIALLNYQTVTLKKGESFTETYTDFDIDDSIEPQTCVAYVEIFEPFHKKVEKKFDIITDPSFELKVNLCKDESCSKKSKTFLLNEKLYLVLDSSVKDIFSTVKLIKPDKTEKSIDLTSSLMLDQVGVYSLLISASKTDYKDFSEKIDFAVVNEHAEINEKEFLDKDNLKSGNVKNMGQYETKEMFLISDKSWQDVMRLVPVTTWTDGEEVIKYPVLIYHEEEERSSLDLTKRIIEVEEHAGGIVNRLFPYSEIIPGGDFSREWTEELCSPDYGFNTPIVMEKHFYPELISVGGTTILHVKLKNCTGANHFLEYVELFNVLYSFPEGFESVNDNLSINKELLPDEEINVEFDFTFENPVNSSFDADSIVYFIQQYNPSKVTVIGDSSQELEDLLISAAPFGGGLTSEQIQRITSGDFASYWNSFNEVVLVESDYSSGLLASVFASLINIPLVIEGDDFDFSGKSVWVIGSVNCPVEALSCEFKTLEQLEEYYLSLTGTDKILLVNSDDLGINYSFPFFTEKGNNPINELYGRNSLAGPFLAAAKHELLLNTDLIDYEVVDGFIDSKIDALNFTPEYLTIIASPNAIDMQFLGSTGALMSADQWHYSKINDGDVFLDLAVGRIFGLTVSDTSSNIARSLFYEETLVNNDKLLSARGDPAMLFASQIYAIGEFFDTLGYAVLTTPEGTSPEDWQNKFYIIYKDHGSYGWAGFLYSLIPYLDNTFILTEACSTCDFEEAKYKGQLFCSNSVRKGAVAYIGATDLSSVVDVFGFINEMFSGESTIGKAFLNTNNAQMVWRSHWTGQSELDEEINAVRQWYTLIGDPTLKIKTIYSFPKPEFEKSDHPERCNLTVNAMWIEIPDWVKDLCEWPSDQIKPVAISNTFNSYFYYDAIFTLKFELDDLNESVITNSDWFVDQEVIGEKKIYWITSPQIWPDRYFSSANDYEFTDFTFTFGEEWLCGDADSSGAVDIDDVMYLVDYIFTGGPAPNPLLIGDVDGSGNIDIDDIIYLIDYVFLGGPAPCEVPAGYTPPVNTTGWGQTEVNEYLINAQMK
ncbi:hypothetical protein KKB11_04300, partial [Candidatus Micrarchaeota archaeon]|nr:hypothetical protein [Candidatus Micrarchaeota archaeon]